MRALVPASRSLYRAHLSIVDVCWALLTPCFALLIRDVDLIFRLDWATVALYSTLTAGFSLIGFFVFRVQDETIHCFSVYDTLDIAKAVAFAELSSCVALFFLTRLDGIPRSVPIIHGLLLAAGLIAIRAFLTARQSGNDPENCDTRNASTILIGANRCASFFIRLQNALNSNQRVIAVLDEKPSMLGRTVSGVRIIGVPQDIQSIVDEFVIHGIHAEQVIVAGEPDVISTASLLEVQRVCRDRGIELAFLPRMIGKRVSNTDNSASAPRVISSAQLVPLPSFFRVKRCIDILASMALIVLLFPVLMAAAVLVLVDVGMPMLFWQRRLGHDGRPFHIYKFRTLRPPFDAGGNRIPQDARLSSIGRFLRATRMDELPQLLNVLTGDMSLIGPRPLLPEDQPPNTRIRLLVRPGITGWAQINGGKLVGPHEKEKLDEWYIRNASLWLDLRIALMTLKVLLDSSQVSPEAKVDAEQVQVKSGHVAWRGAGTPRPMTPVGEQGGDPRL